MHSTVPSLVLSLRWAGRTEQPEQQPLRVPGASAGSQALPGDSGDKLLPKIPSSIK